MIAYSVKNRRCALNNAVETFIQDFMTTGGAITFANSGSPPRDHHPPVGAAPCVERGR